MTTKGHKKVKSEVAPYLKMTLVVYTNYVSWFYQEAHKKVIRSSTNGITIDYQKVAANYP